jgi:hypothetical protein
MQGFYAKPVKAADGTLNMMVWEVGIPGKQGVSESGHVHLSSLHLIVSDLSLLIASFCFVFVG